MAEIPVVRHLLDVNDQAAAANLARITAMGMTAVNLMASPGAGKTTLILATAAALAGRLRTGVIEGDLATRIDADRVAAAGLPVVQINTDGGCHLDAAMVRGALDQLPLATIELLLIENVGNLVCPANFALGVHANVVVASVPEGDDKPFKYPGIYARADAVVLNKADLIELLEFDALNFARGVALVNPFAPIWHVSSRSGAGVAAWVGWLEALASPQRNNRVATRGDPLAPLTAGESAVRLHLAIEGAVQGVGFRPAVYRLAAEYGLSGWVSNGRAGVQIEVEGPATLVEAFAAQIEGTPPPLALIRGIERWWVDCEGAESFEIRASDEAGAARTLLLPDVAICPDCLADICRTGDRRAAYPFTNCTNCGPRFSIIEALPYDRPRTTMRAFALCPECRAEYENPADRRFHAQPTACPACGPALALITSTADGGWRETAQGDAALAAAAQALRDGLIVAVKGLGGFHLMVDAGNEEAVARLRSRKAREEKPLALMARTLDDARALIVVDALTAALLASPAAPIVLAPRRGAAPSAPIAANVAPHNPMLGVMLAYTPLHHLLLEQAGRVLVATSGNRSDEPICTDNEEALDRLGGMVDLFLVHNRPIARHVDDSVVTVIDGAPRILRRARGYAPLPLRLRDPAPTLLAVGGHLKNTIALALGREVFISQHIGDLESPEAQAAFEHVIADFLRMYDAQPTAIAHDLHPDYGSTQWARHAAAGGAGVLPAGLPLIPVQHHHAHMAACLAENQCDGPALGVTWDGSGYGPDGTVWGGEFLLGDSRAFSRVAHLRTFRLAGGEAAVREPRRSALALLWEIGASRPASGALDDCFAPRERALLEQMLMRGVNAPLTSSAGRLFDGLAALLGLGGRSSFEGQAAMALEHAADPDAMGAYPVSLIDTPGAPLILDWEPLVRAVVEEHARGIAIAVISARAHRGLAHAIAAVAARVGIEQVALSGGCFQNRLLVSWTAEALRAQGMRVLLHSETPPNDGCIAFGQIAVAQHLVVAGSRFQDGEAQKELTRG